VVGFSAAQNLEYQCVIEAVVQLLRDCDKMRDPQTLGRIAVCDENPRFRQSAVEKLTDQTLLQRISVEDNVSFVRKAAAAKLSSESIERMGVWVLPERTRSVTDQALLEKIAKETKDSDVRKAAVAKLSSESIARMGMWVLPERTKCVTDQGLLEKIAKEAKDPDVRKSAIEKLLNINERVSLPEEHKNRVVLGLIPLFQLLYDPEVRAQVGDIESYDVSWQSYGGQSYIGGPFSGELYGEHIVCKINLTKIKNLVGDWNSGMNFPDRVYRQAGEARCQLHPAIINLTDSFDTVCSKLSQRTLTRLAVESDPDVLRYYAQKYLVDPSLLIEIAMTEHIACLDNLTDQILLAKVAQGAKYANVRIVAVHKLTDKTILKSILDKDADDAVCRAAQKRLGLLKD
jgi:hypothetical protein